MAALVAVCVCALEEVIPRRPRYQRAVSRGYFFCYARRAEHRHWVPLPSWLRWLKGRLQNHGNSVSIAEKCSPQSLSRAATACEATTSSLDCRHSLSAGFVQSDPCSVTVASRCCCCRKCLSQHMCQSRYSRSIYHRDRDAVRPDQSPWQTGVCRPIPISRATAAQVNRGKVGLAACAVIKPRGSTGSEWNRESTWSCSLKAWMVKGVEPPARVRGITIVRVHGATMRFGAGKSCHALIGTPAA